MTGFNTAGLDGLRLSLEEVADIPEDVLREMLEAEGAVVKAAQEKGLQSVPFKKSTGQLAGSISVGRKVTRGRDGLLGLSVYPAGTRREGKTRNAEVGFIQEYGAPRRGIEPKQWMRKANEESAEEAIAAAGAVYERYLREKGL